MWNLLIAALSAVLLILTFPRFDLAWLAPLALTPLLIAAVREERAWMRFLLGGFAGAIFWFGVCYWIQFVLAYHGGMGEAGGWAVFLLFCVAKAVHLGLFTMLAGYLMESSFAVPLVAAAWVGIERTHGPLGFAWMALGNAGIDMELPMRLAPYVGVYGLSFLFAMLATALAQAYLKRSRLELAWLAVLPGLFLLPEMPRVLKGAETVVVSQPNIDLAQRWSRPLIDATVDRLALDSMQTALAAGEGKPTLIVWPEVPAPFYYESDEHFRKAAENLARTTRTYFLFGTVAFGEDGSPRNSAQLLAPDGSPVIRYDKVFLVPFGEFIPPFFGFVNKISTEAGDFVAGATLYTPEIDGHRIGQFICYESVFPHLVRQFADQGAEVFINLTNDGYFGHSAARQQHLLIARMRAAENRRWLIRATNNGVTVSIDPSGRIRQILPADTEMSARLNVDFEDSTTPYSRYGDWFAWTCLGLGLIGVVFAQIPTYRP